MNSVPHWEKYHYCLIDKRVKIQILWSFSFRGDTCLGLYISLMRSCLFAGTMSLTVEGNKQHEAIYLLPLSKQECSGVLLLSHLTFSGPDCHPFSYSPWLFAPFSVCFTQWLSLTASPKCIKTLLLCAVYYTDNKYTYSWYSYLSFLSMYTHDAIKLLGFQFSRVLNLCPTQFIVH